MSNDLTQPEGGDLAALREELRDTAADLDRLADNASDAGKAHDAQVLLDAASTVRKTRRALGPHPALGSDPGRSLGMSGDEKDSIATPPPQEGELRRVIESRAEAMLRNLADPVHDADDAFEWTLTHSDGQITERFSTRDLARRLADEIAPTAPQAVR